MNYTFDTKTGDGTTTAFTFGFAGPDEGYIDLRRDLRVFVNGAEVPFTTNFADPNKVFITQAPVAGASILIRRIMPRTSPYSDFKGSNAFTPQQLNNTALQQLYLTQEILDGFYDPDFYLKQDLNMGWHKITNLKPGTGPGEAVNWDQLTAVDKKHTDWNTSQDAEIEAIKSGLVDNVSSRTVPWLHIAVGGETSIKPPFVFKSAWVWRDGVMQYQLDGAFTVANNSIIFPALSELQPGEKVLIAMGSTAAAPDDHPTFDEVNHLIGLFEDKLGGPNGASMIGLSQGGKVQDALNYVTPAMFGIKPEPRATSGMTDVSVQLQAMVDYAVGRKLYVDTQLPGDTTSTDSGVGFYISKPLNLTGLAGLRGVLTLYVDSTKFNDTLGLNFAVVAANAQFNGSTIVGNTTRGNLNFDWIEVRNLTRRAGSLRGILWTAARSTVKKLRANGFNGRGVWVAHAYDSNFDRVEQEWCGNKDDWGIDIAFYTPSSGFVDETNGIRVNSILSHNGTDRAWRAFGSKIYIGNVHEEATYSMENPTNPTAQDLRTSLGYINSYFSSTGGSLGPVSIQYDPSSLRPHVFSTGFVGTSISTVYTNGTAVMMPGDPAQRGGFAGTIYCRDLYVIDQARVTISRVEVTGAYYGRAVRNDSPILGGFITTVVENVGDIHNVTFRMAVVIAPANSHSYARCTFQAGVTSASSARVTLDNCIISTKLTTINDTKMDFINCLFSGGLSLGGTGLDVIIKGGQVSGDLAILSGVAGSWLFPDPPRVTGAVNNWQWPLATAVTGSRTRHPAPSDVVGTTVERQFNGTKWITTAQVLA